VDRGSYISSISCSSPGNCTAVGGYVDKVGRTEGLLLTEKERHWARGVEAVLPANAVSHPYVNLNSVSCASAGNCTAVGDYTDASDIYGEDLVWSLLLTEKGGHWARGVAAVPLAQSDGQVYLNSVSCASAGNCAAVGNDSGEGLVLTKTAGHWARRRRFGYGSSNLVSVSCASGGSCSAVGFDEYDPCTGRDGCPVADPLLLTKKGRGREWRSVQPELPPLDGEATFLTSVSCPSAGNCSVVGVDYPALYGIDSEEVPTGLLLTEKAGKWRRGVTAKLPKNAGSALVELAGISCGSAGNCGAMGTYYGRNDVEHLTLLTQEGGKWRRGVEASLPEGARRPEGNAISCASAGNCTVVGSYGDGYGFLLTEIAGRWARGVRAPHFRGGFEGVSSVSCASPGNCGAVGGISTPGGPGYSVLFDSATAPCVVPNVQGRIFHAARNSIESHNCLVGTVEHASSGTVRAGHVISQTPAPGRHRAPGTEVSITVSLG
jgi:hypothetical protein